MKNTLLVFQIIISILLVILILIQSRGTGFARGWSASQTSFTRRGVEKLIFKITFVITFLFISISIYQIFI